MDKNNQNDPGFTLTLSQRTEYDQMVIAAAKYLEVDPTYLQFFKTQSYREAPGHALRCTYDGTLKDLLVYFRPKQPKKMFYQKLAIPIHELENKKQIKCTYLSTDQVRYIKLSKGLWKNVAGNGKGLRIKYLGVFDLDYMFGQV